MAELVELRLFTTPSDLVYGLDRPTAVPYRRIVGMSYGDGMPAEYWSRTDHFGAAGAYDRDQATPETLAMPDHMAHKLISFFERYFANGRQPIPTTDGSRVAEGRVRDQYNCHRFGYWMRGSAVASRVEFPEAPDFVTEGFAIQGGVPMGRHSVLGTPGAAVHSVVGLGRDSDECLQVLSTGGFMGIDTYQHILDHYDPNGNRGMQFYV